jgi:serine-type D-Ala-D-Ala carboxypeptidase (penicillin-binding protein 5/6)
MLTWEDLTLSRIKKPAGSLRADATHLHEVKMRKFSPLLINITAPLRYALSVAAATTVALALSAPASAQTPQQIVPRPPQIASTSYILMDARTGYVIVEENADEPLPPASLTKIMTAYIAEVLIDNGTMSLTDEAHVSEKAWRTQGSKTFLDINSKVSIADLLSGIIIQSGNDASVAMAEHIAGSEDAFADMMNQHAQLLGMTNSYFMNSSGLDSEDNYNIMSARDLAILARATIINHPAHYALYSQREFTYNGISQANRNTLLFRDRNVDGMKTGWTTAAGFCLVGSAERDGVRLISVVMGTASEEARVVETQKLFTYGFRYFETHKLYDAGEVLKSERIWSGKQNTIDLGVQDEVHITIPRGRSGDLNARMNIAENIQAGVERGQLMGTVDIVLDDEVIFTSNVIALEAVERGGIFKRLMDFLTMFFINLFS